MRERETYEAAAATPGRGLGVAAKVLKENKGPALKGEKM